jgi:hypothetical protein
VTELERRLRRGHPDERAYAPPPFATVRSRRPTAVAAGRSRSVVRWPDLRRLIPLIAAGAATALVVAIARPIPAGIDPSAGSARPGGGGDGSGVAGRQAADHEPAAAGGDDPVVARPSVAAQPAASFVGWATDAAGQTAADLDCGAIDDATCRQYVQELSAAGGAMERVVLLGASSDGLRVLARARGSTGGWTDWSCATRPHVGDCVPLGAVGRAPAPR